KTYPLDNAGSAHSSPGSRPHTEQLPKLSLSIGLLLAHVPRNSSPFIIYRMLLNRKEIPKTTNTINSIVRNSVITILLDFVLVQQALPVTGSQFTPQSYTNLNIICMLSVPLPEIRSIHHTDRSVAGSIVQ